MCPATLDTQNAGAMLPTRDSSRDPRGKALKNRGELVKGGKEIHLKTNKCPDLYKEMQVIWQR